MKLFKRMGAEKATCNIELKIASVQLEVQQPLIVKIRWTRGPQMDTSEEFEVSQMKSSYDLNFAFTRTSTFYHDGKGGYQPKLCNLEVVYSSVGKEELTGSIEIDMAPLVGKTNIYQAYVLTGETVTRNTQINAFFTIYEQGKAPARPSSHSPIRARA